MPVTSNERLLVLYKHVPRYLHRRFRITPGIQLSRLKFMTIALYIARIQLPVHVLIGLYYYRKRKSIG